MVDSPCQSFLEPSPGTHTNLLISHSRSESSRDNGSIRLTESATLNLPFFETPTSPLLSKTIAPVFAIPAPRFKENRVSSPERGRSRVRCASNSPAVRSPFGGSISPDRFIPKRDFAESSSAAFRVAKHPLRLSPREKLLRRCPPGNDPFLPPNTRRLPIVSRPQQPTRLQQVPRQRPNLVNGIAFSGSNIPDATLRQVSAGAVWNVGGASAVRGGPLSTAPGDTSIATGHGPAAPNYVARFLPKKPTPDEEERHESRLALALDIDPITRLLGTTQPCFEVPLSPASLHYERLSPFVWKDSAWKKVERQHWPTVRDKKEVVPPKPFRILDAPFLRDDFYCSTLAYSFTSGILAVGLGHQVFLWSEGRGVDYPPFPDLHHSNYVTSLSFSSDIGGRSILAVARRSGQLSLWSTYEADIRFEISHPNSISCVAFKQKTSRRHSERFIHREVETEELAAGDDFGNVWYYSVEWPDAENREEWKWNGSMTLLAKICAHTQQICGLAWSPDDRYLATGGNDNSCLLFEMGEIVPVQPFDAGSPVTPLDSPSQFSLGAFPYLALGTATRRLFHRRPAINHFLPSWVKPLIKPPVRTPLLSNAGTLISGSGRTVLVPFNRQKHRLLHSAAVKAIAFAPWQPSLLATGGGTNDRAIHFYHTRSGACLATISVFAQVTSLIWSQTRREIAATFGYSQPDHPFRIAVFAWPSCAQVAVIPWGPYGASWDGSDPPTSSDCGRALWAVRYPGRLHHPPDFAFGRQVSPSSSQSPSLSRSRSPTRPPRSRGHRTEPRIVSPKEKEGGMWCTRTMEEGCIIVASSDQTVKFHEVWTGSRISTSSVCGLFGGSDILEGAEGIEKSGEEVIR
ncbi:hypothetical protein N7508_007697 [Penicillium antarcticum]|uniref:uncharacterized protein n=1 Tax=Penicillium antarcticum TaxID=416450 RepID=UPI002391352C|nr:uncharacterized protein N7508_007697 [Penicillium antarcticum]KAJ5297448.1 hypothetical protein N7508_007697 [Penicillium antarcticum]